MNLKSVIMLKTLDISLERLISIADENITRSKGKHKLKTYSMFNVYVENFKTSHFKSCNKI